MCCAFSPTKKEIKPFVILKPVSEGDFTFIFPQREQFKPLLQLEIGPCRDLLEIMVGENKLCNKESPQCAMDWALSTKPADLVFALFIMRANQLSLLLSVIIMRNKQKIK